MRVPRLAALAGLVTLALVAGACSSAAVPLSSFGGPSATVVARSLQFQPAQVKLPAGQEVRLVLDNQDAGVPHNVKVYQGDTLVGRSPTISGTGETEVRFGPLVAGTYQFACEVHPSMVGSLVIGP